MLYEKNNWPLTHSFGEKYCESNCYVVDVANKFRWHLINNKIIIEDKTLFTIDDFINIFSNIEYINITFVKYVSDDFTNYVIKKTDINKYDIYYPENDFDSLKMMESIANILFNDSSYVIDKLYSKSNLDNPNFWTWGTTFAYAFVTPDELLLKVINEVSDIFNSDAWIKYSYYELDDDVFKHIANRFGIELIFARLRVAKYFEDKTHKLYRERYKNY